MECSFDLPIRSALVDELQVTLPQVAGDLAARETTDGNNHLDDLNRCNLVAICWVKGVRLAVSRELPYKETQVFL